MMYIKYEDLRTSSYDHKTLVAYCPRCGRTITIDPNEENICFNCYEEIVVNYSIEKGNKS